MSDIVRNQTLRVFRIKLVDAETLRLVIISIESCPLGGYPDDRLHGIGVHFIEFVAGNALNRRRLLLFIVGDKAGSVKLIQPFFGGEPQKSLLVLRDAQYIIVG